MISANHSTIYAISVINNISLAWTDDFNSLKQFTADVLKLNGEWTQPGGDKKVFASGDITLIWRKTKYLLSVDGGKSMEVKKRICEEMFRDNSKLAPPLSIQEAQEGVTAGTYMEEIERSKRRPIDEQRIDPNSCKFYC